MLRFALVPNLTRSKAGEIDEIKQANLVSIKMIATPPNYVIAICKHCDGEIEFDANLLSHGEARAIECPHCQKEIVISRPKPVKHAEKTSQSTIRNDLLAALRPLVSLEFRKAPEKIVKQFSDDHEKLAATYCEWGAINYRVGDTAQAVLNFLIALEATPNCAEAWHNVGVILGDLGDVDRAISALLIALESDPKRVVSWLDLANRHVSRGNHQEAANAFRNAIEIDPAVSEVWSGLGIALGGLMQFSEAVAALRRAIELMPDNLSAWKQLSMSLVMLSEFADALEAIRRALEIDPNDAEAKMLFLELRSTNRESFFGELQHQAWTEHLEKRREIKGSGG